MAQSVSFTGSDTVSINGTVITCFADGDNFDLQFPNDIVTMKVGKDGNVIAAANANGSLGEVTLRVIRGSVDDKGLNSLRRQQDADLPSFAGLNFKLVKRVGDGKGNITNDTYIGTIGAFKKKVGAKSNADGDTEQSVATYPLVFGKVIRPIQ